MARKPPAKKTIKPKKQKVDLSKLQVGDEVVTLSRFKKIVKEIAYSAHSKIYSIKYQGCSSYEYYFNDGESENWGDENIVKIIPKQTTTPPKTNLFKTKPQLKQLQVKPSPPKKVSPQVQKRLDAIKKAQEKVRNIIAAEDIISKIEKAKEVFLKLTQTKKIEKDALRKVYIIAIRKYHPDFGGDVERFRQLTEAYEILSK